jgi:hypothetical protein
MPVVIRQVGTQNAVGQIVELFVANRRSIMDLSYFTGSSTQVVGVGVFTNRGHKLFNTDKTLDRTERS